MVGYASRTSLPAALTIPSPFLTSEDRNGLGVSETPAKSSTRNMSTSRSYRAAPRGFREGSEKVPRGRLEEEPVLQGRFRELARGAGPSHRGEAFGIAFVKAPEGAWCVGINMLACHMEFKEAVQGGASVVEVVLCKLGAGGWSGSSGNSSSSGRSIHLPTACRGQVTHVPCTCGAAAARAGPAASRARRGPAEAAPARGRGERGEERADAIPAAVSLRERQPRLLLSSPLLASPRLSSPLLSSRLVSSPLSCVRSSDARKASAPSAQTAAASADAGTSMKSRLPARSRSSSPPPPADLVKKVRGRAAKTAASCSVSSGFSSDVARAVKKEGLAARRSALVASVPFRFFRDHLSSSRKPR